MTPPAEPSPLTSTQKAAVLLLALPEDAAADVVRRLPRDVVNPLMTALANLGVVPPQQRDAAFADLRLLLESLDTLVEGGWEAAQRVLEQAFGPTRAADILRRLTVHHPDAHAFTRLAQLDPDRLAGLVQHEHPQTVALLLIHLDPRAAAHLLARLPEALALDATHRLARLDRIPPAAVADLESLLDARLALARTAEPAGGVDTVVPILNATDIARERHILDQLAARDPDLAAQIRNRLFTFDDLATLDPPVLQDLLRRLDTHTLALALKGASEPVRQTLLAQLSENARAVLDDEITVLGRVRRRDVEEAQHTITDLLHQLEDSGAIVLPRADDADGYVD